MARREPELHQGSPAERAWATVRNSRNRLIHYDPADPRGRSLAEGRGEPYPNSLTLWDLALNLRDDWNAVLDIGANYGEMLAGVDLPNTRIIAFEPNPHVLPYLHRTIEGLPIRVELVERALGHESREQVAFDVVAEWSGRAHVASVMAADAMATDLISVELTTLDDFFPVPPGVVCMKIDVEGYELHVLRGAQRLLTSARFVAVMLEILHLPVQDVLELSRLYPLYLLDIKRRELVRYTGRDGYELGRALHSGDLYRQDAILLAGTDVSAFDERIRASLEDTLTREQRAKEGSRDLAIRVGAVQGALRRFHDTITQSAGNR